MSATEVAPSKASDYWWTVLVVDPIASPLARWLVPVSRITPMGLTLAAHLLGLVSAALFATGVLLPAAVLFEIRFVLDCVDGKLARLRGQTSSRGAYVDYVGDVLVVGANIVALAAWLDREGDASLVVVLLLPATFLAQIAVLKSATPFGVMEHARSMPGGLRGWMAQRRLHPVPGRVDAENGLLFVLPIVAVFVGETWPLVAGAWVATAGFGYLTMRLTWKGYQLARAADTPASDRTDR